MTKELKSQCFSKREIKKLKERERRKKLVFQCRTELDSLGISLQRVIDKFSKLFESLNDDET